jgi:hypothetical protein
MIDAENAEDPQVRNEEAAAAAEAGRVGGPAPDYAGDEEERPVEEGGGGVSEGFEESERELIEGASHGDAGGSPETDAFTPEAESDEATSEYGEPDEAQPRDR